MYIRYFQKGFNYAQDGPGNRLVYHLQGCNLHCPWCANPEGMSARPPLMQRSAKLPAFLCPHGAIDEDGRLVRSFCETCQGRECVTKNRNTHLVCPTKQVSAAQICEEAVNCRGMLIDGGGVTFTGGEATMQLEPLLEALKGLRQAGIHTAVETNGTHPRLPELIPYLNYYIGDYKHYHAEKLRQDTGAEETVIRNNLTAVAQSGIPMLVRVLLVHGFNDEPEDAEGFAKALLPLCRINPNMAVEFLSYHEYGKVKWEQCGLPYSMENGFVDPERITLFNNVLKAAGIPVVKT